MCQRPAGAIARAGAGFSPASRLLRPVSAACSAASSERTMATKLMVVLKTGEMLTYTDAEVEERSGSCRIRIKRHGAPVDSLDTADVERWFIESVSAA
jgi:hypothetical protein